MPASHRLLSQLLPKNDQHGFALARSNQSPWNCQRPRLCSLSLVTVHPPSTPHPARPRQGLLHSSLPTKTGHHESSDMVAPAWMVYLSRLYYNNTYRVFFSGLATSAERTKGPVDIKKKKLSCTAASLHRIQEISLNLKKMKHERPTATTPWISRLRNLHRDYRVRVTKTGRVFQARKCLERGGVVSTRGVVSCGFESPCE